MKKTAIVLLTLLLYVCSLKITDAPVYARMLVDQAGENIDVPVAPHRVLSLAPSLTEMVFSLHEEAKLVGATRYSNYPEAAKKLPRVGSYVQLDLERIVAMKPDLCRCYQGARYSGVRYRSSRHRTDSGCFSSAWRRSWGT